MTKPQNTFRVITSSQFFQGRSMNQVEQILGRKLTKLERKALKAWPVGSSLLFGNVSVVRES